MDVYYPNEPVFATHSGKWAKGMGNPAHSEQACYAATALSTRDVLGEYLSSPSRDVVVRRLNLYMEIAGLSGRKLAFACGVSPSTMTRWLSGENQPSYEDMDKIAQALKIPVWKLWIDDPSEVAGNIPVSVEDALKVVNDYVAKTLKKPR